MQFNQLQSPWRLSVAPMMDWTDRHCRQFHRLITRRTRLYTEMVTTGALLHGDRPRHLDFGDFEHPVALQIGGSEPADLAVCARLAQDWGYDEINLNCGCPSERVQRGAFGACLMAEAPLVADGVKAMRDAVDIPVTVKHRIGIDRTECYSFVRDFVGVLADAGCEVFIVHARNAWLQGLSPKENRDIPPLRHDFVHRLAQDFPGLTIVLNGGLETADDIAGHLGPIRLAGDGVGADGDEAAATCASADDDPSDQPISGVMIGRAAYHHPWRMADWDTRFFGEAPNGLTREQVEQGMVSYMAAQAARGVPWPHIARHMLGLWNGTPGARAWRQVWSDHRHKTLAPAEVAQRALVARQRGVMVAA